MLVQDVEIIDNLELNIVRKKSKKNQILLYDTQRRADDFISKLRDEYKKNTDAQYKKSIELKDNIKVMTGDYETSLTLMEECYGDDFGLLSCMFNATVRAKRCGGKVVFGSIGLKTDDKRFTAWLSGDRTFSTFADFTKGDNIGRVTPN